MLLSTISENKDETRLASKIYIISGIVVLSVLVTWHLFLIFNINHLENDINILTREIIQRTNENVDFSTKVSYESHSSNLNTENVLSKDGGHSNQEIAIQDILQGSVNISALTLNTRDLPRIVQSRKKRDDSDVDGARGPAAAITNRESCTPKLLNLELLVYARSVEIDTVQRIDRWAKMRGPTVDSQHQLDSSSHIKSDGTIQIQHEGMYMVYAQLTFGAARRAHRIGFKINKNNQSIAKCIDQEHGLTEEDGVSPHAARQCYTSTVLFLSHRDALSIETTYADQSIYPNRDMSFWGLVKLSC